jgi:hypothetical protein
MRHPISPDAAFSLRWTAFSREAEVFLSANVPGLPERRFPFPVQRLQKIRPCLCENDIRLNDIVFKKNGNRRKNDGKTLEFLAS